MNASQRSRGPWHTTLPRWLQAHVVTGGVRAIGSGLFGFRVEVQGRERVPPGEPLIVAGGPHRNWIDGFLLIIVLPAEPRLVFLATENVSKLWWRRMLLKLVGGVELVSTRSALNRDVLQAALRVLERGDRLALFPEGWHHLEDSPRQIGELRRGVTFIAQQSGRRVLPVAIAGAKPLWRGKTLRVRIGEPVTPPSADASRQEEQAWSDNLRQALQALVPPDPPEVPEAKRRWTWLTGWLN